MKINTLLNAAREYSMRVRGTVYLKLRDQTKNYLPDFKVLDEMDYNILINMGNGPDGDKGSSGTLPGFHVFMKPPPLTIISDMISGMVNSLAKILKVGNFPIPKLPSLSGIYIGYFIGEKIGFRFQVKKFSITCFIKFIGGFGISCKLGMDWLSIFEDAGKWIAKIGKKLFDNSKKAFMKVSAKLDDFTKDIAIGSKKIFNDAKNKAKKAYENVKKSVKNVAKEAKEAITKITSAKKKAVNEIKKAANNLKKEIDKIGKKLNSAINRLGREISDLGNKIGKWFESIFNKNKWKRERNAKEADKRNKEKEKKEKEKKEKDKYNKEVKKIEDKVKNAEKKRRDLKNQKLNEEADLWRKKLMYQKAIERLNDL